MYLTLFAESAFLGGRVTVLLPRFGFFRGGFTAIARILLSAPTEEIEGTVDDLAIIVWSFVRLPTCQQAVNPAIPDVSVEYSLPFKGRMSCLRLKRSSGFACIAAKKRSGPKRVNTYYRLHSKKVCRWLTGSVGTFAGIATLDRCQGLTTSFALDLSSRWWPLRRLAVTSLKSGTWIWPTAIC
jgi:hypothetical protein